MKLETNTLLLSMPLISAGGVMIWKWKKARSYIEKDVDWWTLLFFMLLFAEEKDKNEQRNQNDQNNNGDPHPIYR